jgi:hypothetical protein
MNRPLSQSRTLVKRSCMSNDEPSIRGEITARPQPNEEPDITATLPWHSKTLASLTVYGELFATCTPGEFAIVHRRLQQEWTFNGGFVSLFTLCCLTSSSYVSRCQAHRPHCVIFFSTHCRLRSLTIASSINSAMFAITSDSIFKVDSYARTAITISSAVCGLGIACDIWFLIRYS